MKKIILSLLIVSGLAFACELKECHESKVSEGKSIFSCKHGEYEATYLINEKGNRFQIGPATLVMIDQPKILAQNTKK